MRFFKKYPILKVIHHTAIKYPAPVNLTYMWNFGSLALLCLVVQILTGIFLAMHYAPVGEGAFDSVEHIMRDVNLGWTLRYMHSNGASMFFIVVYLHIFRGLYYSSYASPREILWGIGVIILLLMIITAFIGYVLPWGQMSYWAATVITNLVTAFPSFGDKTVIWLWGGYSVTHITLNRFYSFHYILPIVLVGLSLLHVIVLHHNGSTDPMGGLSKKDKVPFGPFFLTKDLYGVGIFLIFYSYFVFFKPNFLGHTDNYILANPIVTPPHIVPEWYFLPFYAILRAIHSKLLGVIVLLCSILVLLILPFINKINVRSTQWLPLHKIFFEFLFWIAFFRVAWWTARSFSLPSFK